MARIRITAFPFFAARAKSSPGVGRFRPSLEPLEPREVLTMGVGAALLSSVPGLVNQPTSTANPSLLQILHLPEAQSHALAAAQTPAPQATAALAKTPSATLWIEGLGNFAVASYSFGVTRRIISPSGHGMNREASAPSLSELVLSLKAGAGSVGLLAASLFGEGKEVRLLLSGGGMIREVVLENALLSSFQAAGGAGIGPDAISINFTRLTMTTSVLGSDGKLGTPNSVSWDSALGRVDGGSSSTDLPTKATAALAKTPSATLWIEGLGNFAVASYSFGATRRIISPSGHGVNREASAPSLSELVLSLKSGSGSVGLLAASLLGEGKKVRLLLSGGGMIREVVLENALLSSFQAAGGAGIGPDAVSINFTRLTMTTSVLGSDGKLGAPNSVSWDLNLGRGS